MDDHHRRLYGTPGLGDLLREVAEAVYARRGPFNAIPLSAFETFVLEQSARRGLDGEGQRRLCFESRMGFDRLDEPDQGHDHPAARTGKAWDEAWRRTWPVAEGAIGDLRPSDVKSLLGQLVAERALPELAHTRITNSDYSWTVERQAGGWLVRLTTRGVFSDKRAKKYGIGSFSVHLMATADGKDPSTGGSIPIFGAFMDKGTPMPHATLEWFIECHRDYARKVSAVAAYLDELQSAAPSQPGQLTGALQQNS